MNGSDKCEYCEIEIARIMAEARDFTKIEHHRKSEPTIIIYYCDICWVQQQSRMFG